MAPNAKDPPGRKPELACYQIKIKGKIHMDWSDWLSGIEISSGIERGFQVTTVTGTVTDQAALRGVLCKIWDLNLTILSVAQIEMNSGDK